MCPFWHSLFLYHAGVFLLEMSLFKVQLILSVLFHDAQPHPHQCSLISPWFLCLSAWLWLLRAGFALCTFSALTAGYCRNNSPTLPCLFPPSLSLIKPGTLCTQRMIWVSLLTWQETYFLCGLVFCWLSRLLDWLVCHEKLHPYLFSFSFILNRPKRSLLIVAGSPKQKNCGFCWREEALCSSAKAENT